QPPAAKSANKQAAVWLYQKHKKVYARSVSGTFTRWRWFFVFATQLFFYGVPWLMWNDRQAFLLEVASRRFYIFGLVFYPQDVIYLTGILILSALSLFLFTAVAGRQWCGYACPQTVYTEIFQWIEEKIEGDRTARMRRDAGPMTSQKLLRKTAKQVAWIVVALWTGFTFVGFFTPIRSLVASVMAFSLGPWELFWMLFYSFFTYGFAGFMREQVCKYMCPYARFQSAMFDRDTLIVTYDGGRGEPRGSRSRKADYKALGLGECINCTMCVQVCPTGIDIRDGLQYECISCAACVDVCDQVMDKVGYPRGLIRYSTEHALAEGWGNRAVLRHVFRPRVLIYLGILCLITIGLVTSLALRSPFKVDVVRDRATLARYAPDGKIENVYRLQIMNASERAQTYTIVAEGLPGIQTLVDMPKSDLTIDAAQAQWITVDLRVPADAGGKGSHVIHFVVHESDGRQVREKAIFLIP
ncbi:MAG: cytochrome c oxidase accessory protein CcoG, partial [Burkholderiaceae bacterium]|nr:cytochrome c oxidase accessory protein CcoG [Burkholderiaceae bacterium]